MRIAVVSIIAGPFSVLLPTCLASYMPTVGSITVNGHLDDLTHKLNILAG